MLTSFIRYFRPYFRFFVLLFILGTSASSKADYIVSTDVTYTWMDTGIYLIKYRIYTKCDQISLPEKIIYFESGGHYFKSLLTAANLISINRHTQQAPNCSQPSLCNNNQNGTLGYRELIYLDTFNVHEVDTNSVGTCEWNVIFSQLIRGKELTTVDMISQGNQYVHWNYTKINTCLNNSSPSFLQAYTYVGCAGKRSKISFQVVDTVDIGDSFSYHLVPALQAAHVPLDYLYQFSAIRPISYYGWPQIQLPSPYGFSLNPVTGLLEFTPTLQNQVTVFCVEVREWRRQNGTMVQVGKIRQDLYFNVLDCDGDQPPLINAPDDTLFICINDTFSYEIETSDPDGDSTYIDWNAGMPFGTFISTNGLVKNAKGTFSWTPTAANINDKPLTFTVTARDNHCVYGRSWSKTFFVYVKGYTNGPQLDIGADIIDSTGLDSVFLQAQITNNTNKNFEWQSTGDGSFQSKDSLTTWYYLGAQDKKTCVFDIYGEILDATPCFLNEKLRDTLSIIQKFNTVDAGADINYYLNDSLLLRPFVDTSRAESYVWNSLNGGNFSNSSFINSLFIPSLSNLTACSSQLVLSSVSCSQSSDTILIQRIFIPTDAGPDIQLAPQDSVQLNANPNLVYQQNAYWTTLGDGYFTDTSAADAWYILGPNDWKNCGAELIWQESYKNLCWSNADTVSLNFTSQTIDAGINQTILPLDTVQLNASPKLGFKPFGYWTTLGDGAFADSLDENTTYILGAVDRTKCGTKLYWNTLYPTCFALQDSLELKVNYSTISAGLDQSLRYGDSMILDASRAHGGQLSGWWSSTGAGIFSDSNSSRSAYYPSLNEWSDCGSRLYWNSPSGFCSQTIDSMDWVRVPHTLDAGSNQILSTKDSINFSGIGSANWISWSSDGTGNFADTGSYQTRYYFSNSDRQLCSLQFQLQELPLAKCFINKDSLEITFTESPVKFTDVLFDSCFMDSLFVLVDTGSGGVFSVNGDYSGTIKKFNDKSKLVYIPSNDDFMKKGVWIRITRQSACIQDSDSIYLALPDPLSIRSGMGRTGPLFIYPNPNNGIATLESYCPVEVFEADVYDAQGKFIQSWTINSLPFQLNLESLSKGIYFVRVRLYAGRVLWLPIQKNIN